MTSNQLWIALLLVGSTALTVGCGDEIICEGGANCATGGGGSGASGGSNTGGSDTGGSNTGGSNTGGSNTGGAGAGSSFELSDVCDELCECDPSFCGPDLQQCYQSVDDYVATAIAAGCHEELATLEACAQDFACLAGVLESPPCLESASMALDDCIYGNPPPPTTVCDEAAIICGGSPEPVQCQGSALCAATCIVQFNSCDLTNPELESCVQGC